MKRLYLKFPATARFLLAILLGISALVLTGVIHKFLPIPFIDVTLLTIATWILYRTDGKSLKALGLNITTRHFFLLILGLFVGVVALGLETLLRTIYTGEHWNFNSSVNQLDLWKTLYFLLPSVVVQELMFRGYLFTKTIEVTNVVTANVIFSILFTLAHVVDKDALQNTGQLIFLAVSIPVGHLLFATALLKSKTLYFPIGLHWSNNWASFCLVGYGKNENVIFPITNQQVFTSWVPFIIMLIIYDVFFLLVTLVIWKWNTMPLSRALRPTSSK
jgi:membrane protease YdiL (CAAX protease family)